MTPYLNLHHTTCFSLPAFQILDPTLRVKFWIQLMILFNALRSIEFHQTPIFILLENKWTNFVFVFAARTQFKIRTPVVFAPNIFSPGAPLWAIFWPNKLRLKSTQNSTPSFQTPQDCWHMSTSVFLSVIECPVRNLTKFDLRHDISAVWMMRSRYLLLSHKLVIPSGNYHDTRRCEN